MTEKWVVNGWVKKPKKEKAMSAEKVVNLKEIADEAREELAEERRDQAKRKIKAKLRQIQDARLIVSNLERELEDLYAELATEP